MITRVKQVCGDSNLPAPAQSTSTSATISRPRRCSIRWSVVCTITAVTTQSIILPSVSAVKQFTTVVNARCGRYTEYMDWLDGSVLADCEERCANILGCEEFGFKDGGPPRCSLFFPQQTDVPKCVGSTDYDIIKSLDAACGENEEIGRVLNETSLRIYEINLPESPFQSPTPQSICKGEQAAVDGNINSLAQCKLECVIHSETVQTIDKKCGGVSYDSSNKKCVLALGPGTNGTSVSENSVCAMVNYAPRASCRAAVAAISVCGNAYWVDTDGRCACLRVTDASSSPSPSSSSSANGKIPTIPNSLSTGRSFTLCEANEPDMLPTELENEEFVLGLPASAFAGILLSSLGCVVLLAATARRRQSRRTQEYVGRSYIGRAPPLYVKKHNSDPNTDQSVTTDLSSDDSSTEFGIPLPRDVPEDDVLDDDPFHKESEDDPETPTSIGSTRGINSGDSLIMSRTSKSSATSITSLGAAFIQLMGLTFKNKSYRESRAMQCQCKRKRAVNYDELNQAHLQHICRLRGINPKGPKDALVIKLILFEDDSKQAVCKQCLLAFPKPESARW